MAFNQLAVLLVIKAIKGAPLIKGQQVLLIASNLNESQNILNFSLLLSYFVSRRLKDGRQSLV